MALPEQYHAYRRASHTVGKSRQIVMLYDGAISAVQQAKEAIAEGRIEDRFNLLRKATMIFMGLQSSLDFESSEMIAATLYDFYSKILFEINALNRTNRVSDCEALIEEIKSMRNVWDEIDRQETSEKLAKDSTGQPMSDAAATGDASVVLPPVSTEETSEPPAPAGGFNVSA